MNRLLLIHSEVMGWVSQRPRSRCLFGAVDAVRWAGPQLPLQSAWAGVSTRP